jgi:hypothetical protein
MAVKKTAKKKKNTTRSTTPKKEDVFFAALAECGNVKAAALRAKLDRRNLYRRRKDDAAFAAAWDEAERLGVTALEDEARRRAYEGWEEPVWYKGKMCGAARKFSDTLLIVLLKAHMPEKYRDRVEHSGNPDAPFLHEHSLSPALQTLINKVAGR